MRNPFIVLCACLALLYSLTAGTGCARQRPSTVLSPRPPSPTASTPPTGAQEPSGGGAGGCTIHGTAIQCGPAARTLRQARALLLTPHDVGPVMPHASPLASPAPSVPTCGPDTLTHRAPESVGRLFLRSWRDEGGRYRNSTLSRIVLVEMALVYPDSQQAQRDLFRMRDVKCARQKLSTRSGEWVHVHRVQQIKCPHRSGICGFIFDYRQKGNLILATRYASVLLWGKNSTLPAVQRIAAEYSDRLVRRFR
ncbi:hypothetical protein [Actinocorallia longicatena]|uniref:Uncharacterized protein n=1 Tax=Actinocorallia longicatena TaxID=111803 RepID=A0ABP6QJL9_9ACTN